MDFDHVILARKFVLPSSSASVLQTLCMAHAFAANGVVTTVIPGVRPTRRKTYRKDIIDAYGLRNEGLLRLAPIFSGHKGIYGTRFRLKLFGLLLSGKKNVFYTRSPKESLFLLRWRQRFALRRAVVYEMHECDFLEHQNLNPTKAKRMRTWEQRIVDRVDGIVAISDALLPQIEEHFTPTCPVVAVPLGYNPRFFRFKHEVDFFKRRRQVVYFGSLYEHKGVYPLVEAFRHLPEEYGLTIVGGKPERQLARLKKLAASLPGGPNRVRFAGHVLPREVPAYLDGAHMIAIPLQSEVQSLSPIKVFEAIGTTIPIVATPLPSLMSILTHGENAWIAQGFSPHDLASAILRVGSDEILARALQTNNRRLAAGYTWEIRARKILDFIASLSPRPV